MSKFDFTGKTALVTGASRGIGEAIALELATLGAHVFAVSRTEENLKQLAAKNKNITPLCVDLSNMQDIKSKIGAIDTPVDLLVNNAGITYLKPFLEYDLEKFDQVMNVNVKAVFLVSQIIAKKMVANKVKGNIVNVSSIASTLAVKDHTAYCTSKAAVDMLTKMMALELGENGIRVNSVNPTVVFTDMGKKAWSDPAKSAPLLSRIPMQRFVEVHEVVDACCFLLSEKSSVITGVSLPIEGGLSTN